MTFTNVSMIAHASLDVEQHRDALHIISNERLELHSSSDTAH